MLQNAFESNPKAIGSNQKTSNLQIKHSRTIRTPNNPNNQNNLKFVDFNGLETGRLRRRS